MAQGTLLTFEEFALFIGKDDTHDLDSDSYKFALLSVIPVVTLATPVWADVSANEVSGSNYTAGGELLTTTWLEAAGTATFDATGVPAASWTQHATGPTNIKAGVAYNNTAVNKDLVCFVDMTTDGGTTPISLVDGDITWTPHASGIFTLA